MLTQSLPQKMNAAIHDCLERCYSSPTPVLCLVEYLQRLRISGKWTCEELMEVRSRVVRILRVVAAGDEEDEWPEWTPSFACSS